MKAHLLDMLENSYCGFIEQLQKILAGESSIERTDQDTFMYFRLSTFMLLVCRLNALAAQQAEQRKANEEGRAA
jgi:hypothetical protein